MNSIHKFTETELPDKKYFYSRLNNPDISVEEFEPAKNVWNKFNIKSLEEYTKSYNENDVLILADISENFRDIYLKTYKLDTAWYFTVPGLSWDSMLKHTKIELDTLNGYNQISIIKNGTSCSISKRITR